MPRHMKELVPVPNKGGVIAQHIEGHHRPLPSGRRAQLAGQGPHPCLRRTLSALRGDTFRPVAKINPKDGGMKQAATGRGTQWPNDHPSLITIAPEPGTVPSDARRTARRRARRCRAAAPPAAPRSTYAKHT